MTDGAWDGHSFLIEQKLTLGVNRYSVRNRGADGTPGELLAFCQQKRIALKEDLRFFEDESRTRELFRIKARRVVDLGGRFDVVDEDGRRIGVLERRFKRSLLRATWGVLDADERETAWAQEESMVIAVLRRAVNLLEFVPIVGSFAGMIPVPYHFTIQIGNRPVGRLSRILGIRDRYILEVDGDPGREIDRRLLVALGVGLDALQSR